MKLPHGAGDGYHKTYGRNGEFLGYERDECGAVRPGTLGYQTCHREPGHKGKHLPQDGKRF